MDKGIIEKITQSIDDFNKLHDANTEVQTNLDSEGRFAVQITSNEKQIAIKHGWPDQNHSYERPGTIDLLFSDVKAQSSYVIYMTECELSIFPELLAEGRLIAIRFLHGEYNLEQSKAFFTKPKEYINFGPGVTYHFASKTKQYIEPQSFLTK